MDDLPLEVLDQILRWLQALLAPFGRGVRIYSLVSPVWWAVIKGIEPRPGFSLRLVGREKKLLEWCLKEGVLTLKRAVTGVTASCTPEFFSELLLEWKVKEEDFLDKSLRTAVRAGNLAIVDWFHHLGINPEVELFRPALRGGDPEMMKRFCTPLVKSGYFNQVEKAREEVFDYAVRKGTPGSLDWLYAHLEPPSPSLKFSFLLLSLRTGRLEMAHWFLEKGRVEFTPEKFLQLQEEGIAQERVELLLILSKDVRFNYEELVARASPSLIENLERRGLELECYLKVYSVQKGRVDLLEYLHSKGVRFEDWCLVTAINLRKSSVLSWFLKRGYQITPEVRSYFHEPEDRFPLLFLEKFLREN